MLFILSAPSGTGKTTLVRMLLDEFPNNVHESVSCTTREMRTGEIADKDYHFISNEEFEKKIKQNDFLEHATVFEDKYGTSREFVNKKLKEGKHVFLVIDTQGATQLMGQENALFIFVKPPSMSELRERLFKRKRESAEDMEERLSRAMQEMAVAHRYDYQIVNDNLHTAYDVLRAIVISEEHKTR